MFIADVGSAIPIANTLEILGTTKLAGTTPVHTTGSGNTITTVVQLAQAIAATDATKVGLASFKNTDFTVDANGFVSITGGVFTEKFNVDANTAPGTNPVVPTAGGAVTITGAQVASGVVGTNVIRTDSLAANTYTIEIQRSTAVAATDITKNGVSHFKSSDFSVDANGFVSLTGGGVVTKFTVDANTAPGTNPVVPSGAGIVTITGAQVASGTVGTNVIRTDSLAANAYTIQIQRSTAVASTDVTKNGVSHFNSANFTVDANGFVSLASVAYTNVTHAMSPYTVLTTDYYLSCDTSGGVITLNFPNAPTAKQQWIVKDRTGNAAASNITVTTPGGVVTFDGSTSFVMNTAYESISLIANSTPSYEVF